jgi:histone acetyltransferase (RNA polymerase elongator complex component)
MAAPCIIPIFISHQGCPHQCVFCNQHSITGQGAGAIGVREVAAAIEEGLGWPRRNRDAAVQVAFYGGTFTGLSRAHQAELLAAVAPCLADGRVAGIRLSTRPDRITPDDAAFLKAHGVVTVELGVQSMTPAVLDLCQRGHTVADVGQAVAALRQEGLAVGIQLMAGLPGETPASHLASAREVVALAPDFVRLYPTLVVAGSELARWYAEGRYRPLSLARAVVLAARLKELFDAAAIPVVRMGLHDASGLGAAIVAGPHHPAFGELVTARVLTRCIRRQLVAAPHPPREVRLARRDQSLLHGQGKAALRRLENSGLLRDLQLIFDPGLPRGAVQIA